MFSKQDLDQNIKVTLDAADPDGITLAGTYPAGFIPLNGALAETTEAILPVPATINIVSAGDDSGVIFTIVGTGSDNATQSEELAGANIGTATSVNIYKTIVSITPDVNTAAAVTAGDTTTADGICLSQSGTANTALIINGAYLSGFYTTTSPQFLLISTAADESANTFTFTGKDASGQTYTYSTLGPNAGTLVIPIPYSNMVDGSISISEDATGNIGIGITTEAATPWCEIDCWRPYFAPGIVVYVESGSTLNYTVEYTNQTPFSPTKAPPTQIIDDLTLASQTSTNAAGVQYGIGYARLRINSYTTGTAWFQLKQPCSGGSKLPAARS